MNIKDKTLLTLTTAAFLSICTTNAVALSTDRDEPLQINSESAEMRDREGYAIYSGSVRLTQGSIEIDADHIEVFFPEQEITHAVIFGDDKRRAYFQQLPKDGVKLVRGTANRIIYQADRDEIRLLGDAIFCQDGNEQKGERIVYDTKKDIMIAKARVQSIFLPGKKPGSCSHIKSDYR
ncbi:MAG: lipopolysaccharide transport periplasmic protein LptA [Thiotrichales bacterium]|jgi:lipopolysaccharide export system protein LptA|nr:MAG: hypothetical protein Sup05_0950 [uncultured Candidatus Thioglobus sp.]MBT3348382.1 lipopolysaccharide transport periplasmic protein LptA [Thiotrichales bacterium]MBT3613022.1 lipopolysaccharide transport periplasmic protein LptA [Thiotrichales bacterium]MBT3752820.1 lipopolysaccharide transport periplasmic protein LptA [Thiotrichales bacterium]MBT4152780.1 lipopolysaccharide transport periplasmic protein LptA [Thiotrichales bacterium]